MNIDLWYKDLNSINDNCLMEIKCMMELGMIPMSDYYDPFKFITWNERCEQVKRELMRRNLQRKCDE